MPDVTIASEILWRKSEISNMSSIVDASATSQAADILRRTMYCFIYAHWEGSVKTMAKAYADAVRTSGLRIDELSICFRAMIAKNSFEGVQKTTKLTPYMKALYEYESDRINYVYFDFHRHIRSEGNLTSKVLREIHSTIGLEYSDYFRLKEKFIDIQLVNRRNLIAHGENVPIEADVFNQAASEVPDMIAKFGDVILDAFQSRRFQE